MVKKLIDHHPTISLHDFSIIKHQGKIIAALNTIPSRWSIGDVVLDISELACVATLPEFRNMGLQRRLMIEYHKQIAEQQYDLSAIEGIPYYYRQFGYEYALPLDEQTRADVGKIPELEIKHVIRPFSSKDVEVTKQLLAKSKRKFYVHSVRDDGIWKMQLETGIIAERVFDRFIVEKEGTTTAYFALSEDLKTKELLLKEITDVDEDVLRSILAFVKKRSEQKGLITLVATVSNSEPFTDHMVKLCEAIKNRPYAWQIRIVDYARLLRKMKPLFQKRLAASSNSHLTEKLNLNFYSFTVQLNIENGVVEDVNLLDTCEDNNIRFNPSVFVQLVLGYRNREELENIYPDFIVRQSRKGIVDTLFPKLPSYIHTEY
jgi:predicted acetyltransferase